MRYNIHMEDELNNSRLWLTRNYKEALYHRLDKDLQYDMDNDMDMELQRISLQYGMLNFIIYDNDYSRHFYSAIRDMLCESYNRLFNKEALVETMHAGVECGIMAAKIDDLDCVSFGPDIIDIHTVKEKLDIASTQRTWELITDVLKQLA